MRDLFRTIRFRLTIWFAGIFSVSAAVAFILFYYLAVQTLQEQIDQELLDKASQFTSVIRQSGLRGAGNLAVIESKAAGEKMIFSGSCTPQAKCLPLPICPTGEISRWTRPCWTG